MRHGLTLAGRYLVLAHAHPDRPGRLVELLALVAAERGNIVSVEHHREGMASTSPRPEVELTVVTRNEDHCPSAAPRSSGAATASSARLRTRPLASRRSG